MNFYDVLAAEKWGGGIPTINFFDLLFAQSMGGGEEWAVYEGTLPATINANGSDMRQYQVWGNTGGVGDRTENLINVFATNSTNGFINNAFLLSNGDTYAYSKSFVSEYFSISENTVYTYFTGGRYGGPQSVCFYDDNKGYISGVALNGVPTISFTTPPNTRYIRATVMRTVSDLESYKKATLTLGSTAPASYVPFGYELDISTSDGINYITTPIYIGDELLWAVNNYADYTDYQKQKVVRAIKKYVLTGNENWEEITGAYASRKYFRWVFAPVNYCIRHACISSHFTQTNITTTTTTVGFDVFDSSTAGGEVLAIRPSGVQSTTLEDFKAWLAEQYAAGTPVTVWCALTVAEEADPPVPLPALSTCEGTTVIDYAGQSVAPEKVLLEYAKGGN